MCGMAKKKDSPNKEATISVRLDAQAEQELEALVDHYNEVDVLGRDVTISDAVRRAISIVYQTTFELGKRK